MPTSVTQWAIVAETDLPLDSARIYRDHVQTVVRWVGRLAGPSYSARDVEDLVQEIFLRVHERLSSFRGDAQMTTWLYAIAENVVLMRRRKDRIRRFFGFSGDPATLDPASLKPTPLEDLERRQSAKLLYRALDSIADKYRTVFILFELEGLSGEQIALLEKVSPVTVRVRLGRARAQLIQEIERIGRTTKTLKERP